MRKYNKTAKRYACKAIALLLLVQMFFGIFAIDSDHKTAYAEDYAVGSYVTFGAYPQTVSGNDETPIEWLVLDRDGDKALLLSRYGLDAQPYHVEWEDITWETCTLRTWLNDDFMNRAFTQEEQAAILLTNVDNSSGQGFDFTTVSKYAEKVTGGNNTQDQIFLLSYAEANEYLGVTYDNYNNTRSCGAPTAYAKKQGAYTSGWYKTADGDVTGNWWLRSPGDGQYYASCVRSDGSIDFDCVSSGNPCVRPALWVDISVLSGTAAAEPTATPIEIPTESHEADASEFAVGNYVTLGTYPQTAYGNDETPIEWLVLDRDGDKALLLSRYALDAQPYNTQYTEITWETCTLRAWLNDDFINRAFTAEEQTAILLTNVDNSDSQGYYSTDGGNDTQDQIFLLSYDEANKYLGVTYKYVNNVRSRVAPTAYAIAQGIYTSSSEKTADGEATVWWWLRSPGYYQRSASHVNGDGSLGHKDVYCVYYCVCPALWVDVSVLSGAVAAEPTATPTVTPIETPAESHETDASEFAVGNYVTFGTYPQTAEGNDETPIEWLVLERNGNYALLFSRYGLDAQPYHEEREKVTWEICTLRTWLNDDFINRAFTAEEQAAILLTNVDNSRSQGYSGWDTSGGKNTQDKIFLLSYAEANKYLNVTRDNFNNTKSRVAPTAYAKDQGAGTNDYYKTADGEAPGWWWLRSPGFTQYYASYVLRDGSLDYLEVHYDGRCVRPALWVDVESGIF